MSHHHHHTHVMGEEVDAARIAQLLAPPGRKVLVTTHRKPDGDAAGSMIGLTRILRELGHDVVMWQVEGPGLPEDLRWLLGPDEVVVGGPVTDHEERLVVSVDAATSHRMTDDDPSALGGPIINIDHHHDNPLWGHYNFVDGGASSSAEMVVRVADALGAEITREVALPLYVGLVTDTGRFSYGSTGAQAHVVAARLIDAGVDPAAVFRRVYEGVPFGDVRLVGRALAGARSELEGRLIIAVITDDGGSPCGACRQFMSEFGMETVVILADKTGAYETTTVGALLPRAFNAESLHKKK